MNELAFAALLSLSPSPAPAPKTVPASQGAPVVWARSDGRLLSESALAARLSRDKIVFVGEQHDQASSHAVEAEVVRLLSRRNKDLVVGLEMVDSTQQQALDDYLSGAMDDAAFAAFWQKAWGFPYDLYKPVLQLCRARKIRLIGLNVPISVIRQVAKGGLASLSPAQRRMLPLVVRPISNQAYKDMVVRQLSGHGPMPPAMLARMLEAMAAWNETMGEAAVAQVNAGKTVVVLVGAGHVMLRSGIMDSVRSRSSAAEAVVLPYPEDASRQSRADLLKALKDPDTAALADFFWLLD